MQHHQYNSAYLHFACLRLLILHIRIMKHWGDWGEGKLERKGLDTYELR